MVMGIGVWFALILDQIRRYWGKLGFEVFGLVWLWAGGRSGIYAAGCVLCLFFPLGRSLVNFAVEDVITRYTGL